MGFVQFLGVLVVCCCLGSKYVVDSQSQFSKQILLHELNYQIKDMEREIFSRCPDIFSHPDVITTGILGRRDMPGEKLELEIRLANHTLEELKLKFMECSKPSSVFPSSTEGTSSTTPEPYQTTHSAISTDPAPSPVTFTNHAFTVLNSKTVTYRGQNFLVLKVQVPDNGMSKTENWCRDYQHLCENFQRRPTGCGERFGNTFGYKDCRDTYNSDMDIDNVLNCNPSNGVATVANMAFPSHPALYEENSFAFHSCTSGTCKKTINGSDISLSYMHAFGTDNVMYTLCH